MRQGPKWANALLRWLQIISYEDFQVFIKCFLFQCFPIHVVVEIYVVTPEVHDFTLTDI